ncbi:hypothetical protein DFJ73DRAFT_297658 [Zopfochytrium polystomum]|nr:hypothetical protein DFJ73DRAFT_297658 [Zopfochytrium polystomum]
MRFDEAETQALQKYLESQLEPIWDGDLSVLAEYVLALLKHDKGGDDLRSDCISQLDDFLKEQTVDFVDRLFAAVESRSYIGPEQSSSTAPISSPKSPAPAVPSKRDISEDEEGDRSFKHTRREDHRSAGSDPSNAGSSIQTVSSRFHNDSSSGVLNMGNGPYDSDADYQFGVKRRRNEYPEEYGGSKFSRYDTPHRGPTGDYRGGRSMHGQPMPQRPYGSQQLYGNGGGYGVSEWAVPMNDPTTMPYGSRGRFDNGRGDRLSRNGGGRTPYRRGRCRDYDEQGFCLRGDQCPFEHGTDRIVIDPTGMSRPAYDIVPNNIGTGLGGVLGPPVGIRPAPPQTVRPMTQPLFPQPIPALPGTLPGSEGAVAFTAAIPNSDQYDPEQLQPTFVPPAPTLAGQSDMPPVQNHQQQQQLQQPGYGWGQQHSQRGNSRGRGFRGGRGRGGHGFQSRRQQNDTLVVENIPDEFCSLDRVNEFFKRFGVITNIQIQPRFKKAIVQYSTPQGANNAWSCPDPVFSNRFVRVYYLEDENGNKGAQGQSGVEPPTNGPTTEGAPASATPTPAPTAPAAPGALPQAAKKPDDKKKQLQKLLELQKQKDQLVQKQLEYQKELMAKLGNPKLSAKDKTELFAALKATEETLRRSLSSATNTSAVVKANLTPIAATAGKEDKEKEKLERLDRELDLMNKLNAAEASADTSDADPALKAQLEALQAEARALGVDISGTGTTAIPPSSSRGRGRGNAAWSSRGRGGMGGAVRSFNLDNRTTKLVLKGLSSESRETVQPKLQQFGKILSISMDDGAGAAVVEFSQRREAEMVTLSLLHLATSS